MGKVEMEKRNLKMTKEAFSYALNNIKVKSIREIARDLNVDHSYLRKKLKKEASYMEGRPGRPRKELDIERIIILYKSGLGCEKIARIFSISTSTISSRIRDEVGTLRTMNKVWSMRKAGETEESVEEYMARSGGASRHKDAVKRLEVLQKLELGHNTYKSI